MGCSPLSARPGQAADPPVKVPRDEKPVGLAVGQVPIANRAAEDHLDRTRTRDHRASPATFVRALDVRRQDRQVVPQRQQPDARLELAHLPVGRSRPFGEQDDVGALAHLLAAPGDGPRVEPVPLHGDRIAQQKGEDAFQWIAGEVVLRAQRPDAVDPAQRKRRQQHKRVEVAGVIGHDQVPPQPSQLGAPPDLESMKQPQVGPQENVDHDPDRPGDSAVPRRVEDRWRRLVTPQDLAGLSRRGFHDILLTETPRRRRLGGSPRTLRWPLPVSFQTRRRPGGPCRWGGCG